MKKLCGWAVFAMVLTFATCNASWAAAPAAPAAPMAAAAQPGCQPVLDLGKALTSKAETCPATTAPKAQAPQPEFMALGKTCRCSCGAPCTTDADCDGGAGSCRVGISCC